LKIAILFLHLIVVAFFLHLESQQHKSSGFLRERQPQIRVAGNDSELFFSSF